MGSHRSCSLGFWQRKLRGWQKCVRLLWLTSNRMNEGLPPERERKEIKYFCIHATSTKEVLISSVDRTRYNLKTLKICYHSLGDFPEKKIRHLTAVYGLISSNQTSDSGREKQEGFPSRALPSRIQALKRTFISAKLFYS